MKSGGSFSARRRSVAGRRSSLASWRRLFRQGSIQKSRSRYIETLILCEWDPQTVSSPRLTSSRRAARGRRLTTHLVSFSRRHLEDGSRSFLRRQVRFLARQMAHLAGGGSKCALWPSPLPASPLTLLSRASVALPVASPQLCLCRPGRHAQRRCALRALYED